MRFRWRPAASASLRPGRRRAGEVEPPNRWMLDELVADRRRLPGRVRDDVERAGRQAGLAEDLAPEQAAGRWATHSDGFSTTVLPSASGAAIERAERMRAAFQGAIAPTTPTGCARPSRAARGVRGEDLADRRVGERGRLAEQVPARSAAGTCRSRTCSPSRARAARRPRPARSRGCPPPSGRCAGAPPGGVCDHAGNAAAAASTARRASSRPPAGTRRRRRR